MKAYRLFHRVKGEFRDVTAESAQEACDKVGWLIGDVWVRVRTQGRYSHGWANVTSRKGEPVMAKTESKSSASKPTLRAQCEDCVVYDEHQGRMVHHMGRETEWRPGPGYDPNIREFRCIGCKTLFYKRCTNEELLDE
jgi:hypothetical protein